MRRRVANHSETDYFIPETDRKQEPEISYIEPNSVSWSAVFRIVFCFICGSVCLTISLLIYLEIGFDSKFQDRIWPLFFIGLITFIPGAFYIKSAIGYACGIPGYSIPD